MLTKGWVGAFMTANDSCQRNSKNNACPDILAWHKGQKAPTDIWHYVSFDYFGNFAISINVRENTDRETKVKSSG